MAEPSDTPDKKTTASESAVTASENTDAKQNLDKASSKSKKADATTTSKSKSTSSGVADKTTAKKSSVPGASPSSAASAESAADKEKKSGGLGTLVVLVIVILLIAGGAFATKDVWLSSVQPYLAKIPGYNPAPAAQAEQAGPTPVDVLSDRIAAIEKRLSAPVPSSDADAMAALKEEKNKIQSELTKALTRIDDIERRLSEVRRLAQAVTSSSGASVDLGPVMTRIDDLEQSGRETSKGLAELSDKLTTEMSAVTSAAASAGGDGKASGVVLAAAQLRDRALSGQPYGAQLTAFLSLAQGHPDLTAAASQLTNAATAGLPTVADLSGSFSGIASDVVILSRAGDGDWLQQAAGRLSSLVAIRRTDGQSGDPVEDAVAVIESHLSKRDVPSAAEAASTLFDLLPSEAQRMMEPWLLDAKARAGAERALDALQTAALAGLGG